MKTPRLKVNRNSLWVFAAVALVLLVGACSEDKTPPDDENSSSGRSDKASAFSRACGASSLRAGEFRSCALNVLEAFSLGELEKERLSSCNYEFAEPETSPVELFEQLRLNVRVNCED